MKIAKAKLRGSFLLILISLLVISHLKDSNASTIVGNGSWTLMNPTGTPPSRIYFDMYYDPINESIIMFGGRDDFNFPYYKLGDTQSYNFITNSWTNRSVSGSPPSPRWNPELVYDSDRNLGILFGGFDPETSTTFSETYAYDSATNSWSNLNPTGSIPGRSQSEMVYDSANKKIILFGGLGGLSDTWEYDYTTNTWSNRNPSVSPTPRASHSMVYDSGNDKIILFGGDNSTHSFNDTWVYDYSTNIWTEIAVSRAPPVRSYSDAIYDPINNITLIYGGGNITQFGSPYRDLWGFDYQKSEWFEIPLALSFPRYAHEMAYDTQYNQIILFGGSSGPRYQNETWRLSILLSNNQTVTTTQTTTATQTVTTTQTVSSNQTVTTTQSVTTTQTISGNQTITTTTQTVTLNQTSTPTVTVTSPVISNTTISCTCQNSSFTITKVQNVTTTDSSAGFVGNDTMYIVSISSFVIIVIIKRNKKKYVK